MRVSITVKGMDIVCWVRQHYLTTAFLGAGVVSMGIGMAQILRPVSHGEVVVIATPAPQANLNTVVVDVAGAVEQPGVYHLPAGSRVADALIAAGGLAHNADRSYVARYLNQAEVVEDARKLFIPLEGELAKSESAVTTNQAEGVVSVNSASLEALMTLFGIGEQRAKGIIENRPYKNLMELSSKAQIPASIIERNKTRMSVH